MFDKETRKNLKQIKKEISQLKKNKKRDRQIILDKPYLVKYAGK